MVGFSNSEYSDNQELSYESLRKKLVEETSSEKTGSKQDEKIQGSVGRVFESYLDESLAPLKKNMSLKERIKVIKYLNKGLKQLNSLLKKITSADKKEAEKLKKLFLGKLGPSWGPETIKLKDQDIQSFYTLTKKEERTLESFLKDIERVAVVEEMASECFEKIKSGGDFFNTLSPEKLKENFEPVVMGVLKKLVAEKNYNLLNIGIVFLRNYKFESKFVSEFSNELIEGESYKVLFENFSNLQKMGGIYPEFAEDLSKHLVKAEAFEAIAKAFNSSLCLFGIPPELLPLFTKVNERIEELVGKGDFEAIPYVCFRNSTNEFSNPILAGIKKLLKEGKYEIFFQNKEKFGRIKSFVKLTKDLYHKLIEEGKYELILKNIKVFHDNFIPTNFMKPIPPDENLEGIELLKSFIDSGNHKLILRNLDAEYMPSFFYFVGDNSKQTITEICEKHMAEGEYELLIEKMGSILNFRNARDKGSPIFNKLLYKLMSEARHDLVFKVLSAFSKFNYYNDLDPSPDFLDKMLDEMDHDLLIDNIELLKVFPSYNQLFKKINENLLVKEGITLAEKHPDKFSHLDFYPKELIDVYKRIIKEDRGYESLFYQEASISDRIEANEYLRNVHNLLMEEGKFELLLERLYKFNNLDSYAEICTSLANKLIDEGKFELLLESLYQFNDLDSYAEICTSLANKLID
ncbi:hypothetical protein AB751O23_DH_00010, partial [Chlamydiales bacterium SCGC AB-751-O23]